jgi:membrane-associated phospholipid phosphatase
VKSPAVPRRDLVGGGIAIVLLVFSVAVAHSGKVGSLEQKVFRAINGLPDFLNGPMTAMQYLGVLVVPLVFAAVAAVYRKWWLAIALVLVVPLKLFIEKGVLKQLVDRQRPGTTEPDVVLRAGVPAHGPSFPSGHAIIAWAIAWLLFAYLPRGWRWVPIGIAALVCFARVYLGAHNPLDVVAGGAAGVLIGAVLDALIAHRGAARRGTTAIPG